MKLGSLMMVASTSVSTAFAIAAGCGSSQDTTDGATTGTATGPGTGGSTSADTVAAGPGSGGASSSTGMGGGTGGQGAAMPKSGVDCTPASGAAAKVKLTPLPLQFTWPMLAVSPVGDDERLFVVERQGYIQLVKNGVKTLFLDIHSKVRTDVEYGFLGLAFHPNYANNGRFFVHYSLASDGSTTIEEYRRDPANPDKADSMPVGPVLLSVKQPFANHDGGSLEFSPKDGFIYLGLGDGGNKCDQDFNNGPNVNVLLGKMLRLDVSTNPYKIPPGNLAGGKPEIWDYGLRNPFRFNFDACTGDLYIGDVGQNKFEEIDVEPAGKGNFNYGWNIMEGTHCLNEDPVNCPKAPMCNKTGLQLPAAEYPHAGGKCSVTGGRVYRGHAIPWLRGAYLYGDYCTGQVFSFRWNNGTVSDAQELTSQLGNVSSLTAFGQDNKGEIYVVQMGNNQKPSVGTVSRLDPG
jgi:glucose/arabinose dehydrogenase